MYIKPSDDFKGTVETKLILNKDLEHEVLTACPSKRLFIDVGACVGLWSIRLYPYFQTIEAFEPAQVNYNCLRANCSGFPHINTTNKAVGHKICKVAVTPFTHHGSFRTREKANGVADMVTLDSLNFENVDLIKIDTEGYELFVLEGAEQLIKKQHPVVVLEQKNHTDLLCKQFAALDLIKSWNYKLVSRVGDDFILK